MTQDAAVRTIVSLASEIEKRGAEDALTAYAESHDLPAAQLEKLAQVYNTHAQLSHIQKAADRGSCVPMIDVPLLVTTYATDLPTEKTARAVPQPSHTASEVDLMSAVKREAFASPTITKAASHAAPKRPSIQADDFRDVLLDLECEAMLDREKAAKALLATASPYVVGMNISVAEDDACQLRDPDCVKRACDWFEAYANAVSMRAVDRCDYQTLTKSGSVAGGRMTDCVVALTDACVLLDEMRKLAAIPTGGPDTHTMPMPPVDRSMMPEQGGIDHRALATAQDFNYDNPDDRAAYFRAVNSASGEPADAGINMADRQSDQDTSTYTQRRINTTLEEEPEKKDKGGAGSDKKSKGDTKKDEGGVALGKLMGALAAPVRGVGHAIQSGADKTNQILTDIVSKDRFNSAQHHADVSVADIRRSINLRRLIGTDPVLRESDPHQVLEIYNAIARTNPEVAHNMQAVKLLLREAVSYEGLTLDSQKQLADVRKSQADSEAKERENEKSRYSTGASSLLAAATKKA